jgi:transposase-like protein
MTKSEMDSEVFQMDSKGRVRVSRERREQLLDEFEQSGLSGAQFARMVGVKYQTFAFWRQERQRSKPVPAGGSSQKKATTVEWLETVISEAQASAQPVEAGLVVRLPSGAAIELSNLSQVAAVAALLRAWEKAAC